jgi:O-antigen ligase
MEPWRPLIIVLLVCFIYGFIGFVLNFDLFKQEALAHGRRFGGPFDDPMNFAHIYGMYTGLLSALVLFSLPLAKSFESSFKDLKAFYTPYQQGKISTSSLLLSAWILTSVSILLSLTRGAWIGVSVAFLIIAFIYSRKIGAALLTILSFIFVSMLLVWTSFRERVLQAFHPSENYDSERVNLWRSNWEMFKDHFYFGVGHGDYKNFLPDYFQKLGIPADHFQSHAHNQYLQALSNTGIFGFLCYMLFIIGILYLTVKYFQKTKNQLFLASLAAQISFHLGAFTECNFERSKVRLVYLFFCALSLTLIAKFEDNKNSRNSDNLKENT